MEKTLAPTTTAHGTCNECRFCGVANAIDKTVTLICRVKPPVATAALVQTSPSNMAWNSATVWPNVNKADWCGSFEPQRH